jgi:hypothetical protein
MARTDQELRRELGTERAKLAEAVETLRAEATDISGKLKTKLPVAAVGAVGLGFVASEGIRATVRLLRSAAAKAKVSRRR